MEDSNSEEGNNGVDPQTAVKILFLSNKPDHGNKECSHSEECGTCNLIASSKETIHKESFYSIKKEYERKLKKIRNCSINPKDKGSKDKRNFSGNKPETKELSALHEEVITFCGSFYALDISPPEGIEEKNKEALDWNEVQMTNDSYESFADIAASDSIKETDVYNRRKDNTDEEKDEEKRIFNDLKKRAIEFQEEQKRHLEMIRRTQSSVKDTHLAYSSNRLYVKLFSKKNTVDVFRMIEAILKRNDKPFQKIKENLQELNLTKEKHSPFQSVIFFLIIIWMQFYGLINRLFTKNIIDILESSQKEEDLPEYIKLLKQYPIAPEKPGICFIFAMLQNREGALVDATNVENLFKRDFKYDVEAFLNPTKDNIENCISQLNSGKYILYDSMVIVFMAHGSETKIKLMDGYMNRRVHLIGRFANAKCFRMKPKLFFFQACENMSRESAEATKDLEDGNEDSDMDGKFTLDTEVVNPLADTIVCHPTMWHDVAIRRPDGSPYVDVLVSNLKKTGRKNPIEEVLRDVHNKMNMILVAKKVATDKDSPAHLQKQTPYYESSFQKEFKFPDPKSF